MFSDGNARANEPTCLKRRYVHQIPKTSVLMITLKLSTNSSSPSFDVWLPQNYPLQVAGAKQFFDVPKFASPLQDSGQF